MVVLYASYVEMKSVAKLCKHCQQEMEEQEILKSKVHVCYNDKCVYLRANSEGDTCKRYAENSNGSQLNFETCHPPVHFIE